MCAKAGTRNRCHWPHYSPKERTPGRLLELLRVPISGNVQGGSARSRVVTTVAKELGLKETQVFLPAHLTTNIAVRGVALFGVAGDLLEAVADNYDDMVWYIDDLGLHFEVDTKESRLSRFDQFAGKLVSDKMAQRKLSDEALREIARLLDEKDFDLVEELEPAQSKPIREFNQKYSRKAVKSFVAAVQHAQFRRGVRRRLYRARDRYGKL